MSMLPRFYHDWVIYEDDFGTISVIDAENYHVGLVDKPNFSSNSLQECLSFVHGGSRSLFLDYLDRSKITRMMLPLIRFYLKIRPPKSWAQEEIIRSDPVPSLDGTSHKIEYGGWMKPFRDTNVGNHPVFNFTNYPPVGFHFVQSNQRPWLYRNIKNRISIISSIYKYSRRFMKKGVPFVFVIQWWVTRGFHWDHVKIKSGLQTLVLYPTYLFLVPNHSWFIEIEDMLTLMAPFVSNGAPNPTLNRDHPVTKVIETLIEGEECKGVLCHLNSTAEGLRKIYQSNPKVAQKIRFIPLGMRMPPRRHRERKQDGQDINILFLNGWAQDKRASYRRGLLDALKAFSLIADEFEHVTFIVRCNLPQLDEELSDVVNHPRVTLIQDKLPIRQLQEIYRSSDILLFPAVRIAVTTLLQAMAHSLAIVASDGFGVEEYVNDGENGLIGRGFHGATGHMDEDGFFRENYLLSLRPNLSVAEACAAQLRRLIKDPDLLLRIQEGARDYAEAHFTTETWNQEFGPLLEEYILSGQ